MSGNTHTKLDKVHASAVSLCNPSTCSNRCTSIHQSGLALNTSGQLLTCGFVDLTRPRLSPHLPPLFFQSFSLACLFLLLFRFSSSPSSSPLPPLPSLLLLSPPHLYKRHLQTTRSSSSSVVVTPPLPMSSAWLFTWSGRTRSVWTVPPALNRGERRENLQFTAVLFSLSSVRYILSVWFCPILIH